LTPQASALAGLRYAPNHWSAHSIRSAPGFNAEDCQTFGQCLSNIMRRRAPNRLAALPALR
jgi:hypothetical protein